MPDWSFLVARLVSAIGSWLDASNLRNRLYKLKDDNEILLTALEDIKRMDPHGQGGQLADATLRKFKPTHPPIKHGLLHGRSSDPGLG